MAKFFFDPNRISLVPSVQYSTPLNPITISLISVSNSLRIKQIVETKKSMKSSLERGLTCLNSISWTKSHELVPFCTIFRTITPLPCPWYLFLFKSSQRFGTKTFIQKNCKNIELNPKKGWTMAKHYNTDRASL